TGCARADAAGARAATCPAGAGRRACPRYRARTAHADRPPRGPRRQSRAPRAARGRRAGRPGAAPGPPAGPPVPGEARLSTPTAPAAWAALLEDQAARYAATGTAPALAAQPCRALAAVAGPLSHLTPEQTTPAELLAALDALRLDLDHWHLHRPPPAGALPARAP